MLLSIGEVNYDKQECATSRNSSFPLCAVHGAIEWSNNNSKGQITLMADQGQRKSAYKYI